MVGLSQFCLKTDCPYRLLVIIIYKNHYKNLTSCFPLRISIFNVVMSIYLNFLEKRTLKLKFQTFMSLAFLLDVSISAGSCGNPVFQHRSGKMLKKQGNNKKEIPLSLHRIFIQKLFVAPSSFCFH